MNDFVRGILSRYNATPDEWDHYESLVANEAEAAEVLVEALEIIAEFWPMAGAAEALAEYERRINGN